LRAAEVRFDSPAESLELDDLRVRQRLFVLSLGFDRAFVRAAALQRFAQSEARVDRRHLPIRRDRVRGEQDPRDLREHHPLDHDGHLDATVIDAVLQPIRDSSIREQRGPATGNMREHALGSDDVQIRVLLTRERCRRQILRGRARSHGVRVALADLRDALRDRARDGLWHWRFLDDLTDPSARLADCRLRRGVE
jgi:hypothetical protein